MAPDTPPSIAVVHLLRRRNDIAHFERFVRSCRAFPDPLPHEMIVLFKGFGGGDDAPALSCLAGTEFTRVDMPDSGFDIGPYLEVARSHDHDYFCFLNSFSEIRAENWLSKLHAALVSEERAGVVGATGSWETTAENDGFPNYHLRTNGFMISGELLRDLETWEMCEKRDTSRFEAGHRGLTGQILARGLEPYVIDRRGCAWAKEDWPRSNTYRAGEQEGLLIGDKRTEAYRTADPRTREYLSTLAWSDKDPGPNPFKRHKLSRRLRRWLGISRQ